MAIRNPYLDMLRRGIGAVESSNNYGAIGPEVTLKDGTKHRAYGVNQVMDFNIPNWTQAALGRSMTPQAFLKDKAAQDAVFDYQMGKYLDQYNNPQDAASMWFSGRPVAKAGKASDGYNTVPEYIQKVMRAGQTQQDPRSFVASATPQATGAAPMNLPGATLAGSPQGLPAASVGPQSISLGDEEQQPFNNIGSTLANMGASIASLDRGGTGIASLNASNVARNLAAQEAMREKQGGWKYVGQTDNGQGLIFQKGGETRIEPVSPQFAGQKEPEAISTLRALAAPENKELLEIKKELTGDGNKQEPMLTDDGRKSVVEDYLAGNDAAFRNLNKADVAQAQNLLADFKKRYDITSEDIMANRGKWRGIFGAEREYAKRVANVGSAEASLSAAIDQGRNLLKDPELKSLLNQPKLLNQFNQFTVEQLNSAGLGKLAQLKENFETVAQDYTRVNAMGGSTTTVRAQDIARSILNTGMSDKAINELFDFMGQTGLRVKDALAAGQEELRTNARKHTKLEDYKKSQEASEKRIAERLDNDMVRFGLKQRSPTEGATVLPAVGKKTIINGVEIERLD